MTLKFEIQEGAPSEAADVRYRQAEFSLDYRHRRAAKLHGSSLAGSIDETLGIRGAADYLVIASTLVMVFEGETKELVAFDAYTNRELWMTPKGFTVPELSGAGSVCLVDPLPDGRIDLSVDPVYSYSEDGCFLQISLGRVPEGSNYYQVSDKLIVGIRCGMLTSLLVQGLKLT